MYSELVVIATSSGCIRRNHHEWCYADSAIGRKEKCIIQKSTGNTGNMASADVADTSWTYTKELETVHVKKKIFKGIQIESTIYIKMTLRRLFQTNDLTSLE